MLGVRALRRSRYGACRLPSVAGFFGHIRSHHSDTISEDQFFTLLADAARPVPSGINRCPLCDSTAPADSDLLFDHIAEHLHSFALRSLPWPRDDFQDRDDRGHDYFDHNDYFDHGSEDQSHQYNISNESARDSDDLPSLPSSMDQPPSPKSDSALSNPDADDQELPTGRSVSVTRSVCCKCNFEHKVTEQHIICPSCEHPQCPTCFLHINRVPTDFEANNASQLVSKFDCVEHERIPLPEAVSGHPIISPMLRSQNSLSSYIQLDRRTTQFSGSPPIMDRITGTKKESRENETLSFRQEERTRPFPAPTTSDGLQTSGRISPSDACKTSQISV